MKKKEKTNMRLDNKIYLITTIKRESDHTKEKCISKLHSTFQFNSFNANKDSIISTDAYCMLYNPQFCLYVPWAFQGMKEIIKALTIIMYKVF